MKINQRFAGNFIVAISIPVYFASLTSLFYVAIMGWTSDYNSQPAMVSLLGRIMSLIFFLSNIALTRAGWQLRSGELKKSTCFLLCFGSISLIMFYGQMLLKTFYLQVYTFFHPELLRH